MITDILKISGTDRSTGEEVLIVVQEDRNLFENDSKNANELLNVLRGPLQKSLNDKEKINERQKDRMV